MTTIEPSNSDVEPRASKSISESRWLWLATLAGLTLVLYAPVFRYDFVNWDDPWYVINNPYLKSWSFSNLWDISTDVINRNYAPITIFTYLLEYTCWGASPTGYHAVNILLHTINAMLVCVLVSQLTDRRSVGWMTGALFAVHPVQIESVAWISSMKGLLCATFMLACSICWMRPARTERQSNWGMAFFVCALLSKALTIVLPPILLLYDMLVCRKKFREAWPRQFVPGLLSLWLLLKTMAAQGASTGGIRTHLGLSKLELIGVDAVILWDYVRMLFWPSQLSVLYNPATSGLGLQITIAGLCWVIVGVLLWRVRKTRPLVTLAAATWLLLLLPVLNFTPITTLINDRYLYMPAIPFFGAVCYGLHSLAHSRIKQGWLAVPCVAVVALCVATRQHLPVWRNDESLWRHSYAQTPELPVVRIQYAMLLHRQERDSEAISLLQKTLADFNPDHIDRQRIEHKIEAWKNGDQKAGDVRTWIIREVGSQQPGN